MTRSLMSSFFGTSFRQIASSCEFVALFTRISFKVLRAALLFVLGGLEDTGLDLLLLLDLDLAMRELCFFRFAGTRN